MAGAESTVRLRVSRFFEPAPVNATILASKSADGKPDSLKIQAETSAYCDVDLSHLSTRQPAEAFCEAC